jgi:2-keto-4-pentenoate hydratase/2-oxohepta-3-ene-1,7-dioic acid hydratase in catechol pathway
LARIVRYASGGTYRYGEENDGVVSPLEGEIGAFTSTAEAPLVLQDLKLLTPCIPHKVVCIGPGYLAHLQGNAPPARPRLWIKPRTALLDPEGTIVLPNGPPMVCHEPELAIVIGKTAKDVSAEDAADYIFGYTCINDITAGKMTDITEFRASQYFVDGKIYDTFGPVGPWIETNLNPDDLQIECRVNGQLRQRHRTTDRIWTPAQLVEIISSTLTLLPGDVIGTGSPPGMGPLAPGDTVEVEVEGIGVLRNRVAAKAT